MMFPGPVLSARAFKQSGPSQLRSLSANEYTIAVNCVANEGKGTPDAIQIPRQRSAAILFVEESTESITLRDDDIAMYIHKYDLPMHKAISQIMQQQLCRQGLLPQLINDN